MKHQMIRILAAALILAGSLSIQSCEPPLCAYCYQLGELRIDGRDIEICADDPYELEELVWITEDMGYRCEYR